MRSRRLLLFVLIAVAHGSVNAAVDIAVSFAAAGSPPDTAATGLLGWTGWLVPAAALLVAMTVRGSRGSRS